MAIYSDYASCLKCRFFIRSGQFSNFGYETQGYCSVTDANKYPAAYCSREEGYEELDKEKKEEKSVLV